VAVAEPIPRVERLAAAGPSRRNAALAALATGVLLAAGEILVFDWDPVDMAPGAVLGTCLWGTVHYLRDDAKLVPRGAVLEAPRDIVVERPEIDLSAGLSLVGVAALCIPLAWLLDRFDVGAAFVPGLPFGYAAAALVAVVRIRRWERANGRRVLLEPDSEDPRPYAGPPL
jgi:hypothetical protein